MDMVASASARAIDTDRQREEPAPGPVPGGRRADGAPGAARQLRRDQQLLHLDRLREGRRGRAHDADAGRPRRLRARHDALLRAPRRPGRHLRRLRAGDRRRQPGERAGAPAAAVQALVFAVGNAEGDGARPLRRAVAHLHARPRAVVDTTAGQRAVRHPAGDGPGRPRRPGAAAAPGGRSRGAAATSRVLVLSEARSFFTFVDVDQPPVLSLLRGFSAPVVLVDGLNDADLLVLLRHDSDPFNRWEAGQRIALHRLLAAVRSGEPALLDAGFIDAMRDVLRHPTLDPAFKELVLTLPSEGYVAEQLAIVDPPNDPRRARSDEAKPRARAESRLGVGVRSAPGDRRLLAGPGLVGTARARQPQPARCSASTPPSAAIRSGRAAPTSASRTRRT